MSLPKSIFFNFRALPLKQACRLPVFVHYNTTLINIHKGVLALGQVRTGLIRFGFGGTYGLQPAATEKNLIEFGNEAKIVFSGRARFAKGTTIRGGGIISFGSRFSSNRNCFFGCNEKITIGNDVLLGWNVTIRDSDNHKVFRNGELKQGKEQVTIGNHVWICSCADVLKGTFISDESVVAYRALVTRKFDEQHVLIGGAPARILQDGISWEI